MKQALALPQKKIKNKTIPGLVVRQTASRLLSAIIDKKISLDGLFDTKNGHPHYLKLSKSEKNLCRAILQTSLRHHAGLDWQLNDYLQNPLPKNAHALRHLIHIGATQILHLRIPSHAAIFLAVAHSKCDPRTKRFSGLVNAILRKFDKDGEKYPLKDNPLEHIPQWFKDKLLKNYPKNIVEQIVICQNFLPNLDLRLKKDDIGERVLWSKKLKASILPAGALRLANPHVDVPEIEGFNEGKWFVQNAASSLVVHIMGNTKGKKIIDLCAAPGGKTAQLISKGAQVTAIDNIKTRFNRLNLNLKRLNLKANTWFGSFQNYPEQNQFDIVLLDAPCSSTGTIRRHADVLWTKDEKDISLLIEAQKKMLSESIKFLKKNGMLIFSNCSILMEEGEILITDFLKKHNNMKLLPITAEEYPELQPFINEKGCLRTTPASLPNIDPNLAGMDGFFAARFIKEE